MRADLSLLERLSIVILSVGGQILLLFIELSILGSLRWPKLRNSLLKTIRLALGFLLLYKKRDSTTGSLMQRIGVFLETDIGEIPFPYGSPMTVRKLFALGLLKNLGNFQDAEKSKTYTEKILITLLFLLKWAKEFSKESLRFSIAGLSLVLCLSRKFIILLVLRMKSSTKDSLQTS